MSRDQTKKNSWVFQKNAWKAEVQENFEWANKEVSIDEEENLRYSIYNRNKATFLL